MKIPLPCKFGELSDCDGKLLPLCGVHWFDWMSGRQYTYFFETGDQWHPYTFYETRQDSSLFLWKYQMIFFLMVLLKKRDIRYVEQEKFLVLTIVMESCM